MQSNWVLCLSMTTLLSYSLQAAEFSLVPVSSSGASTIVGNQITLSGGGQRVFLEIQLSGWSPSRLKAWQCAIDGTGYASGLLGVVTPATQACVATADCETAFGNGATCTVPVFNPNRCTAGFIDSTRTDYVFASVTDLAAVDISTLNYRYGATVLAGDVVDPGSARYGGAASLADMLRLEETDHRRILAIWLLHQVDHLLVHIP